MEADLESGAAHGKPDDPFHGFELSIRSLFFNVDSLKLVRSWSSWSLSVGARRPAFPTSPDSAIAGIAHLENDVLSVIGTSGKSTNEFRFLLTGYSSFEAHQSQWRDTAGDRAYLFRLSDSEAEDTLAVRLADWHRRTEAFLEDDPPTLRIGFEEGSTDAGSPDTWFLQCEIPQSIFVRLAEDLEAGDCDELRLFGDLARTLTDDKHAPPEVPVDIGVLPRSRHSVSGHEWGKVTHISWETASIRSASSNVPPLGTRARQAEPYSNAENSPGVGAPGSDLSSLINDIRTLARVTQAGFILVLLLILALAILT